MSSKFAIITPYHKESQYLLEECVRSVLSQSVATDHILVSDGHPNEWLTEWASRANRLRHISLPHEHKDYGGVARAMGSLMAIGEEYDGFGWLDADNFLSPNHVESCIQHKDSCDYVIARRLHVLYDGVSYVHMDEEEHTDTNCFFLFPSAFKTALAWATIPKKWAPVGDRCFTRIIQSQDLQEHRLKTPTVHYRLMYDIHYKNLGLPVPSEVKPLPEVHYEQMDW